MSSTSTAPLPRSGSRPQRPAPAPLPAAPAGTPRSTGQYRYDVRADRWWWSPEALALLGHRRTTSHPGADVLLSVVHPDDQPGLRRALADSCTTGRPFALEHRVVHGDEVCTVLLVGEPESAPGGGVTVLRGLLVDVTSGRPAEVSRGEDRLRSLEAEVEQLRTAMASRAVIEQAKGALMLLTGCGDQVAFDLLAHISSHTHRKVRDVAGMILDSAGGRGPLPDDVGAILRDACPPGRPDL